MAVRRQLLRTHEKPVTLDDAFSLTGRSAVVTGAGAGIGRAIALAFAQAGAAVACVEIDDKTAAATASAINKVGARAKPFASSFVTGSDLQVDGGYNAT